jgi:hypothetical protein
VYYQPAGCYYKYTPQGALKAPQAVLFHATAIHCHYGTNIEDASFFVLECVTDLPQIQTSIQPGKIEKWTSELNCHEESTQEEEFVAIT